MVTTDNTCKRVEGALGGGEYELPCPFLGGAGVFNVEGVGKDGFTVAFDKVFLMQGFYILKYVFDFGDEAFGEDSDTVVVAFAAANDDLAVVEVHVFDAQAHTFHDAESATVKDFGHEAGNAAHVIDDFHGFGMGEDSGQTFWAGGVGEVGRERHVSLENDPVEEEEGTEGLILGGCGDFAFGGEVSNKGTDFVFAHVLGVSFFVEEDVAFDPVFVGLFGAK